MESVVFFYLTLPYDHDTPTKFPELSLGCLVPHCICYQFWFPEFQSAFWHSILRAAVLMPETSMNKNHFFLFSENEIWSSRKLTAMKSVTESKAIDQLSNSKFRLGVTAFDAGHPLAALSWGKWVEHALA
jgi:hypothetical protein